MSRSAPGSLPVLRQPNPSLSTHCGVQERWTTWEERRLMQHKGGLQRPLLGIPQLCLLVLLPQAGLQAGGVLCSVLLRIHLHTLVSVFSDSRGCSAAPGVGSKASQLRHLERSGSSLENKQTNPPKTLALAASQTQLRRPALPKGQSMVCLGSLLLYVYLSVLILFKELVHNQS